MFHWRFSGGCVVCASFIRGLFMFIKFLKRLSPASIKTLYSGIAVLLLAFLAHNYYQVMVVKAESNDQCVFNRVRGNDSLIVISDVVKNGATYNAGIQDGDTLLAINDIPLSFARSQQVLNTIKNGELANYRIRRGTAEFTVQVRIGKVFNLAPFFFFIAAFGYLLIGTLTIHAKPLGELQQRFTNYSYAVVFVFSGLFSSSFLGIIPQSWRSIIFFVLLPVSISAFASQITFFNYFPRNVRDKNRWSFIGIYAISIAMHALIILLDTDIIPRGTLWYAIIQAQVSVIAFSFYPIGLALFTTRYFKLEAAQKKPLRPVLIGVILAQLALIYFLVISSSVRLANFINPELLLPGILFVAPPFTIGYAIFRYGLMDIDVIIERSIIFAIVTTLTAVMYVATVSLLSDFISGVFAAVFSASAGFGGSWIVTGIAFVLIAMMFDPLKRRIEDWVAKILYHERINYQKALLEFSRELPGLINFHHIVQTLSSRLASTMHLEQVIILLNEERFTAFTPPEESATLPTLGDEKGSLFHELQTVRQPVYIERHPLPLGDKQRDENILADKGIVLAVPMLMNEHVIGLIAVGKKLSGKAFSRDDLDLLMTLASQAAIAFENARLHESEIQKQKMEDSLALARRIQEGLLPKRSPHIKGLDVIGISLPAEIIGGDFYDLIELSPGKLLVVVGDVSGKGMSAALYMSRIQGMLQLAAHSFATPKEILTHVNRHIYESMERNSFVTLALALFDTESMTARICRAGHTKPLIANGSSMHFLEARGLGIGLSKDTTFERCLEEVTLPLQPNMTYVFYSDGLNEAVNSKREQFGTDVLCNVVKVFKAFPAVTIRDNLIKSVADFRAQTELYDDLTIVVVKTTQELSE